ncbi:relaxase/mobilization nuclease domain-containing protein [Endozoicomonas ascidiicola]|uniref:relaxase/mobilization nuclease domain-containing protein n=1 Tax=Endozoicomonas ascidiicola TaxID=1698521 RepID=UPI000836B2EE|nr:relaxase/mobilization nuclease domain-containing protein [Endozoicomonas ascidiicola]
MIADAKLTGSVPKGVSVAHYMLNPDAKSNDHDVKQMQSAPGRERILHIETDSTLPILITDSAKASANSFFKELTRWNRNHRPGKSKPKSHWEHRIIAFHPDDSKKIDAKTACQIAREALSSIAPGERPALFVAHGDTEHLHIHMLYSTVNDKGRIFNLHQDYRAWELVMENLEIKYDLTRVDKRIACSKDEPTRASDGKNPTKPEFRAIQRTGEPSCKQQLRTLIDDAIRECKTTLPDKRFSHFITLLQLKNIGISANIQSTERVVGMRFYYGIFKKAGIKASSLGRSYSWNALAKTTKFDQNTTLNTHLLKVSDHRVRQWANTDSGGIKLAHQLATHIAQFKNNQSKRLSSTSRSITPAATAETPVEYPSWLREYLHALARAVNSEIMNQQKLDRELSQSIAEILDLFSSFQKKAIESIHQKTGFNNPDNKQVSHKSKPAYSIENTNRLQGDFLKPSKSKGR